MAEILPPGCGAAVRCDAARYHSPHPLIFTWHYLLPAECGGTAEPSNLIQLCHSCHASIHLLMWQLANGGLTVPRPNWRQLSLARHGYQAAVEAGTLTRIPRQP